MLSKLTIEKIVDSQKERLIKIVPGLPRVISGFDKLTSHAFIVTGIRRCGKSTLLQQINIAHAGADLQSVLQPLRLKNIYNYRLKQ